MQADALSSESSGKPPSHTNRVLGKTEGRRKRRRQTVKLLDGIVSSMDMRLSKPQGIVKDREAYHAAVHGVGKGQTLLSDLNKDHVSTHHSNFCWTVRTEPTSSIYTLFDGSEKGETIFPEQSILIILCFAQYSSLKIFQN